MIGLTGAIPILLGDNIGTTITALLASIGQSKDCLLYTSDAADELDGVDLGGRRIIKKKFFQAEDGILDVAPSRGLGDVYKRQVIFIPYICKAHSLKK